MEIAQLDAKTSRRIVKLIQDKLVPLSAQDDENRPPEVAMLFYLRRANKTPSLPVSARWRGGLKSPASFVRPGTPVREHGGIFMSLPKKRAFSSLDVGPNVE